MRHFGLASTAPARAVATRTVSDLWPILLILPVLGAAIWAVLTFSIVAVTTARYITLDDCFALRAELNNSASWMLGLVWGFAAFIVLVDTWVIRIPSSDA